MQILNCNTLKWQQNVLNNVMKHLVLKLMKIIYISSLKTMDVLSTMDTITEKNHFAFIKMSACNFFLQFKIELTTTTKINFIFHIF